MKTWLDEEPINIGTGTDVTIAELARLTADVVGFTGRFVFDNSKPGGTPRKLRLGGSYDCVDRIVLNAYFLRDRRAPFQ